MMVDVSSGTNITIIIKLAGNGTGYILIVNLRYAFGGYLLLEYFYFFEKKWWLTSL